MSTNATMNKSDAERRMEFQKGVAEILRLEAASINAPDDEPTSVEVVSEREIGMEKRWRKMDEDEQIDLMQTWIHDTESREDLQRVIPPAELDKFLLEMGICRNDGDDFESFITKTKADNRKEVNRISAGFPGHLKRLIETDDLTDDEVEWKLSQLIDIRESGVEEQSNFYYELRNEIIQGNFRYVMERCKRWRWASMRASTMEYSEFFNEGIIGLTEAIEKFDPERASMTTFRAYAVGHINNAIKAYINGIADKSYSRGGRHAYRIPQKQLILAGALTRYQDELSTKLSRRPTLTELYRYVQDKPEYQACSVSKEGMGELLSRPVTVSFDSPIGDEDDGTTLEDFIENPHLKEMKWKSDEVELCELLFQHSGLTEDETVALQLRFHFMSDPANYRGGRDELFSMYDIARIMDVKIGVVKNYVRKGLEKMKERAEVCQHIMQGVVEKQVNTFQQRSIRKAVMATAMDLIENPPKTSRQKRIADTTKNAKKSTPKKSTKRQVTLKDLAGIMDLL